ncbi:uncharacterized protein LOC100901275 [Galendromus occidentalis]|uniref:Choline/ethanolamine transporter FLVCR1 n=1 Tax=Galendromus occidentalis TaxID=34638 RepID=A0AAJ6VZY8_9ACAR|nr:uncharacterized protein LOC100901275 [Galendromus occidentalis]
MEGAATGAKSTLVEGGPQPNGPVEGITRVYPYRYAILFLFCMYSLANAFGWVEYSIIHDIVKDHYNIENDETVNWTALLYSVSYIPLIFPATWLMEKKGLRFVIILGAFGTALGSWIKVFSCEPHQFWITMTGQAIVACSQIFILSIPPRLAAVWFSSEEVSRACAIGVFGNQVGIALGFVLPTIIVPSSDQPHEVAAGLRTLFIGVAVATTLIFFAIIFAFKEKPDIPPNRAQITSEIDSDYLRTMRHLFSNMPYVLLLISYGVNVGVFYAISTLLNQVVTKYLKGQDKAIGFMGLSMVVAGMFGSVICGVILDRTKKFKEVTLALYLLTALLMFAYTFVLSARSLPIIFVTIASLGFFMTGYIPIGFELSSELTYPEPESTSSGLLNASAQIFGILFTLGATRIESSLGDITANVALSLCLIVGVVMTGFIRSDLRRQKAFEGNVVKVYSIEAENRCREKIGRFSSLKICMKLLLDTQLTIKIRDASTVYRMRIPVGSLYLGYPLHEVKSSIGEFGKVIKAMEPPSKIERREDDEATSSGIEVYRYRFVVLFLFCCFSMSNAFQWVELSIIQSIVMKYYNVNETAVNWTATVYCATYIPLIFPASWLMGKKGLRFVILIGAFGTTLGAWIKVFGVAPDRFWLLMVGQTVVASSQIFVLSIPPRLAAVWFSPDEISRACAVGVFGNQVGIALGFQIPTLLVPNVADLHLVEQGLKTLSYGVAAVSTIVFVAVLIGFREKPPCPPNLGQLEEKEPDYGQTMKNLVKNRSYILHLIAYGINTGTFYAISILLDQILSRYFKGQNSTIGFMGFALVITGMIGSVVCGVLLDKTKKFKEITLMVYLLSTLGMFAYTFVLSAGSIWPTFAVISALGFFMTGYLPIGFEFASELTYPEPEGTTSGLLNASAQVFGILFMSVASMLDTRFGDVVSNLTLGSFMIIGTILTVLCKADLRRQRAFGALLNPITPSSVVTVS